MKAVNKKQYTSHSFVVHILSSIGYVTVLANTKLSSGLNIYAYCTLITGIATPTFFSVANISGLSNIKVSLTFLLTVVTVSYT